MKLGERLPGARHTERLAELGGEAIEKSRRAQELLNAAGLPLEHLARQVGEHGISAAAELLEGLGTCRQGNAEGGDGEPDERRPASGQLVECSGELGVPVSEARSE